MLSVHGSETTLVHIRWWETMVLPIFSHHHRILLSLNQTCPFGVCSRNGTFVLGLVQIPLIISSTIKGRGEASHRYESKEIKIEKSKQSSILAGNQCWGLVSSWLYSSMASVSTPRLHPLGPLCPAWSRTLPGKHGNKMKQNSKKILR